MSKPPLIELKGNDVFRSTYQIGTMVEFCKKDGTKCLIRNFAATSAELRAIADKLDELNGEKNK